MDKLRFFTCIILIAFQSNPLPAAEKTNTILSESSGNHILFVKATNRIDINVLNRSRLYVFSIFRMPIKIAEMEFKEFKWDGFRRALDAKHTMAAIIVLDNPGIPPLLVNPEERIAIVNTLAYSPIGTRRDLLETRVSKELSRAYCALLGSSIAPVFSTDDLDRLKGGITPMSFSSIFKYAKAMGMDRVTPAGSSRATKTSSKGSTKISGGIPKKRENI